MKIFSSPSIFYSTGEDTALSDQPYRYLTVDEMKSLGDDSLPIDVTRDERADNKMNLSSESAMGASEPPQALEDSISPQHVTLHQTGKTVTDYAVAADNIVIGRHPQHVGYVDFNSFFIDKNISWLSLQIFLNAALHFG